MQLKPHASNIGREWPNMAQFVVGARQYILVQHHEIAHLETSIDPSFQSSPRSAALLMWPRSASIRVRRCCVTNEPSTERQHRGDPSSFQLKHKLQCPLFIRLKQRINTVACSVSIAAPVAYRLLSLGPAFPPVVVALVQERSLEPIWKYAGRPLAAT